MQTCQVCQTTCQPLRCTKCKKAYYCSIECQKTDWKAGHRQTCRPERPSQETADWALRQLVDIKQGMTAGETKKHLDKAGDEVKRMQEERDKQIKRKRYRNAQPQEESGQSKTDQSSAGEKNLLSAPMSEAVTSTGHNRSETRFEVVAEEMKHISRFQVTLRQKSQDIDLDLGSMRVSTSKFNDSSSLVEIVADKEDTTIFAAIFPRRLENGRLQKLGDNTLHLNLPYQDDLTERELGSQRSLTSIENINAIQCSSCEQPLLPLKPIQRTSELPVGHWDEIADYLICYSGQAVVDFSIASANSDPSVALQDSNVLCLNHNDLLGTACVLPIHGYGEEEEEERKQDENTVDDGLLDASAAVRGARNWRDVTGGASVCCSQCSAPIGFASMEAPESFRLLKHRLSIPGHGPPQRLSSCASFLAREMVRYAESKAIFTFIVTLDAPKMSFASNVFVKCILLRLVSWDCNISKGFDGSSLRLDFGRYAKLVFEETYDRKANQPGIGTWMWGGVDLCCPPEVSDSPKVPITLESESMPEVIGPSVSTARILLQEEEYSETLQSLRQGQKLFTNDIAAATILVKMGAMPSATASDGVDNLGLTAISVQ